MTGEVFRRTPQHDEDLQISRSQRDREALVPLTSQPSKEKKDGLHYSWHVPALSWSLDFNPIVIHVAMLEAYYRFCGLEPRLINIDRDTRVHCWVPAESASYPWHTTLWCGGRQKELKNKGREAVLLLHGFGASAIWQWMHQVRALTSAGFDVYMPDLVFFGGSWSASEDRSEAFQAQSMHKLMRIFGVDRFHVNGISYGGFVAYRLASLFPESVQTLTLTNSGLMMTPEEYQRMLSRWNVKDAAELLLPSTPEGVQRLMNLAYHHPPHPPQWLLSKTLPVLFSNMVEEKKELLEYLNTNILGNTDNLAPPKMDTLLIWGAHDEVFPVAIAERMKSAFSEASRATELVVLTNSSHMSNVEDSLQYNKALLELLKRSHKAAA